jgi:hypothetical protein
LVTLPGTAGNGLLVGDVNGDGLPDLVSAGGYVDYGIGGGYFTNPISYPVGGGSEHTNVVLADLLRNGQTDIITGSYFAISVLLNLG